MVLIKGNYKHREKIKKYIRDNFPEVEEKWLQLVNDKSDTWYFIPNGKKIDPISDIYNSEIIRFIEKYIPENIIIL